MEFQEVVRRRRMIRRYADAPVDPAVVDRLLSNAVRAPNAGFTQGWAFLVLDTPADVARFWASTSPDPDATNTRLEGMGTAPVVIVPMSDKDAYLSATRRVTSARPTGPSPTGTWTPRWRHS
ncbi:nitroreductase family protein [Nocardioides sp. B-3]|uniref:nitroreductase family protein n=1 Tax=Nocardioides sp. B-3 TaxID=2895565 RepID=UPI002153112B|nr:nitroreductase family protein [Nocardioides sp. B-3]UUZ61395.1 nitroreductase family protein [Nocardioides sp. B-3]